MKSTDLGNKNSPASKVFFISNVMGTDQVEEIADGLLVNRIFINYNFPVADIDVNEAWLSDPFSNRSWRFWLHTLIIVEYLIRAYEIFNNQDYFDKALDIYVDWETNNFPDSESEMVWHDHSTALRLIIISKLYEHCLHLFTDKQSIPGDLPLVAAEHCRKLATPSFYRPTHNHGLYQDTALYVGSVIFSELPESESWRMLAKKRLDIQLEQLFLSDGSYLEHTPSYNYLLCMHLNKFAAFLKRVNESDNRKLQDIILKQIECFTYMIQPDGLIPPLGDGNGDRFEILNVSYAFPDRMDELQYAVSGGKTGISPAELDHIFPAGGYAVLRNQWKFTSETVQLIFYSAFNSKVHKHHDDLALILFGHGQQLLIDPGKYNYIYDSPGRQFVVSSIAHNSVTVDDGDTLIDNRNKGKSGLTSYYCDGAVAYLSGAHRLYPGVLHRRIVIYLKPHDILVLDLLDGEIEHKYEQVFNFHPDVDCVINKHNVIGTINNKECIIVKPLHTPDNLESTIVRGCEAPWRGWCCLEYSKLAPAYSLGFIQHGNNVRFAAHISLAPYYESVDSFAWNGPTINITIKGKTFDIDLSGEQDTINIDNRSIELNRVNSAFYHPR